VKPADVQIDSTLLQDLAPAGYYVAVRVGFAFPEFEANTLPLAWVHIYTRSSLMLYDPVIRWVYDNVGCTRWSDIELDDPRAVLGQASAHGLKFGGAVCVVDRSEPGVRTFGTFGRPDREFDHDELARIESHLRDLHRVEPLRAQLTDAEIEALAMMRDGLLTKEIAYELDISESAVKQRLRNAKTKLSAKTTLHAVTLADRRGLFRMI
jgi:LuxR family transcriptional regulator